MRVLIAAGGTGGHLFPAEALAAELTRNPQTVIHLVTDRRAGPLLKNFPAEDVHFVEGTTLKGSAVGAMLKMAVVNAAGLLKALPVVRRVQPDIAVGFGGYPTLAPLIAARLCRVPVIVHEANAVMGRANRLLAKRAHVVISFPSVRRIPASALSVEHLGMPVRQAVRDAAAPYETPQETFNLLVFGGSQGARAFSDLLPPALAALPQEKRARLSVVQQARPEDVARVSAEYEKLGVKAEISAFFADLPERMAKAHLVIARSGASTVTELAIVGRPALLVPLPGAIDQDQLHNANAMEALGGAKRLDQAGLSGAVLAAELAALMDHPDELAAMAGAAGQLARPRAAAELAYQVNMLGGAAGWAETPDEAA